ncbi:hypothetical protein N8654_03185 [Synechococcus sp. AH-601-B19]|nr:hypothetical protein [Synechococcus sp. AH-601-B19]
MIESLKRLVGNPVKLYLDQEELDDAASLLDRCEELEIFLDAPSISEGERQDATVELQSVIERLHYYAMNA